MELIFTREVPFKYYSNTGVNYEIAMVNVSVDPSNPYEIHVDCTYNGKTAKNRFTSDDELVTKQQVTTIVDRNCLIQESIWELIDMLEDGCWGSPNELEVE